MNYSPFTHVVSNNSLITISDLIDKGITGSHDGNLAPWEVGEASQMPEFQMRDGSEPGFQMTDGSDLNQENIVSSYMEDLLSIINVDVPPAPSIPLDPNKSGTSP